MYLISVLAMVKKKQISVGDVVVVVVVFNGRKVGPISILISMFQEKKKAM